ncbi:hypothetical protein [Streptomyces sp. NPDC050585]|uniref:hypothetical protein n=1 Tax=Streptomyces sp. NPDC050585 TaxID=3365632 RepID=UPI00378E1A87
MSTGEAAVGYAMGRMTVGAFLRRPFRSLGDGGYAGLVFVLARSADNPELHRRVFREWPDTHDVTCRYLGVITPAPRCGLVIDAGHWRYEEHATAVEGVSCLGESSRLDTPWPQARSTLRMDAWPPRGDAEGGCPADGAVVEDVTLLPALTHPLREHQDALTAAAGEMRRFFGVSEELLPCAVVVSLLERRAYAVALGDVPGLYALLKRVRVEMEPVTVEIDRRDAELAWAREARHALRSAGTRGDLLARSRAQQWQWSVRIRRLAADLIGIADRLPRDEAELCRWMASRLAEDGPLTEQEDRSAQALARILARSGDHRRLPRRLRRALAVHRAGHFGDAGLAARQVAYAAEERAVETRIGQLKAEIDDLGRRLCLGAAVVAAAQRFGLAPTTTAHVPAWRELAWPVEVLVPAARDVPQQRGCCTIGAGGNVVHHSSAGTVLQAGAIHGDVHVHGQPAPPLPSTEDADPG